MAQGIQDLLPGYWLPAILSAIIVLLSMTPMLVYVLVGWRAKELDIKNSLGPPACLLYFKAFYASAHVPADGVAAKLEFDRIYDRWYGRRFFLVPGLVYFLTMALSVLATVLAVAPAGGAFVVPNATVAAIAGAFMWCVNDQVSRSRRLDFSPSDLLWASLRMVIAVPLGYAFSTVGPATAAVFLAFALGAFPLTTLQIMLRRLAAKYLGTEDTVEQAADKIICLQGIDTDIVERLRNEDVTTITQLAYCDPVRLTMRSNLTFTFVIDAMSQALAWLYFEDKLDALRPLGLRGAIEFRHFIEALDATDQDAAHAKAEALEAFPTVLKALSLDPTDGAVLRMTMREIADDPYTVFLSEVWDETALTG
jgi:hypothetical protein